MREQKNEITKIRWYEQQMQKQGKEDIDKTIIEKKDKTQRIMQEIEKTIKLNNENLII